MSTLFAHIGAEKCGSSLIEYLFLGHPKITTLLDQGGIVYTPHLHIALRKVVLQDWDAGLHGRLRAQFLVPHLRTGKPVFMSEELLLGISHEPGHANPLDGRITFAKNLFRGFDAVKIIIIVRRQDKFIESHYNQDVKRGETRGFDEVFASLPLDNYKWDLIADTWAAAFGRENLTVVPFEPSVLKTAPGGPANTPSALFRCMGMNVDVDAQSMPVVNPSLRPDLLKAQREINAHFKDTAITNKVADILAREVRKEPGAAQGLFTEEGRQALLDRYAEANRRLFEMYIPQCAVDEYLTA